ncbi:hypothetical protein MLD38_021225 [Melastoma candidum]|uniref:Uncharacterized protein n=1 Tax=Melastoma candidum TaxID=119954 RepID=A0ACB9QFB0_9MYRT|nr:hypothetical protein MLD38_021225 [Melastoma candidum]
MTTPHRATPRHSTTATTTTTSPSTSSSSTGPVSVSVAHLSFDSASLPNPPTFPAIIKPHRSSSDSSYSALSLSLRHRPLSFRDFRLLRRVGSGDTGTVFLCSLAHPSPPPSTEDNSSRTYYAMKVVDRVEAERKKKTERVETERRVLRMVNHPFLPTLYAEFEVSSRFSCVMMEYCEGGDLHALRHRLPNRRFPLSSSRFYAAEVLLALEYLHMLGIIYRDLKPENVLIRSDGHIMLSDFDLSLFSDAVPSIESPSMSQPGHDPPSPCLPITTHIRIFRPRKMQSLNAAAGGRLFVAEPVAARSLSFVGTHEYVSPEVASGKSHGSAVDWWALGVFLYEMIYGRTPFAGASNKETLRNIIESPLRFPHSPSPAESTFEARAQDLISGLLCKDPERRLGSRRGATDIKKHPFFKGLNFALIRSLKPPEIPSSKGPSPSSSGSYCRGQATTMARFEYF